MGAIQQACAQNGAIMRTRELAIVDEHGISRV
jgi:hypothetical protein